MNSFEIVPKQKYKRLTWKNGLGFTDEIAIYPEGAELKRADFLWRLSSAKIDQASPFSAFPNHDRVLLVLKGQGVRLSHCFEEGQEEEQVDVLPFEPYEFPGDISSRCDLISGPITDLSVFVRKAEVETLVETVEVEEGDSFPWIPAGTWNFVFAAQGSFEVVPPLQKRVQLLNEGDTLRAQLNEPISEEDPVQIRSILGAGKLVVISLQGDGGI